MPELPEVHTTATMLHSLIKNLRVVSVWTNYDSPYHKGKDNIKNKTFFKTFSKKIIGAKFTGVYRRGKNVLLELDNGQTILIHMKMTGHILYGKYFFDKKQNLWTASEIGPLQDGKNQFIRFVISLSDGKHLALSDMRKFAKVTISPSDTIHTSHHLKNTGPEPLDPNFSAEKFEQRLNLRPKAKIKQALMDPKVVSGIGNIYSDEILFHSSIHPLSITGKLPHHKILKMFHSMKTLLNKGISFGGDSMSDYRNPLGEPGKFQVHHSAYRKTNSQCSFTKCNGKISRVKTGGRSAHFCTTHQLLYK